MQEGLSVEWRYLMSKDYRLSDKVTQSILEEVAECDESYKGFIVGVETLYPVLDAQLAYAKPLIEAEARKEERDRVIKEVTKHLKENGVGWVTGNKRWNKFIKYIIGADWQTLQNKGQ